jgi:ribonuclease P protein component
VKRRFRLTSGSDFERVRQTGKSFPHSLLVLVAAENGLDHARVGVAAGKSVGGAVVRNRAKRLLRASLEALHIRLIPGWDMIFFARRGLPKAGFFKTRTALEQVVRRAGLLVVEGKDDGFGLSQ